MKWFVFFFGIFLLLSCSESLDSFFVAKKITWFCWAQPRPIRRNSMIWYGLIYVWLFCLFSFRCCLVVSLLHARHEQTLVIYYPILKAASEFWLVMLRVCLTYHICLQSIGLSCLSHVLSTIALLIRFVSLVGCLPVASYRSCQSHLTFRDFISLFYCVFLCFFFACLGFRFRVAIWISFFFSFVWYPLGAWLIVCTAVYDMLRTLRLTCPFERRCDQHQFARLLTFFVEFTLSKEFVSPLVVVVVVV